MALYLGIDGGGSKTMCALGNDTAVLAVATTGGSNPVRVGEDTARDNLRGAIAQVCASAGVSPRNVHYTVIGVAGASVSEYVEVLRRQVEEITGADVSLVGDNVVALEAAFSGLPGVIVIAGTGSMAYGRNSRGEMARAGGYGFAVSDEGSGHWIGRQAVTAALRTHDCGNDNLVTAILAAWKLSSIEDLVRTSNATPHPDFAKLFPVIVGLAAAGEALSTAILEDAGRELARIAGVVISRLWLPGESVRVALGGGVFGHAAQVRQSFLFALRRISPAAAVCFKIIEPVLGALWLARKRATVRS